MKGSKKIAADHFDLVRYRPGNFDLAGMLHWHRVEDEAPGEGEGEG